MLAKAARLPLLILVVAADAAHNSNTTEGDKTTTQIDLKRLAGAVGVTCVSLREVAGNTHALARLMARAGRGQCVVVDARDDPLDHLEEKMMQVARPRARSRAATFTPALTIGVSILARALQRAGVRLVAGARSSNAVISTHTTLQSSVAAANGVTWSQPWSAVSGACGFALAASVANNSDIHDHAPALSCLVVDACDGVLSTAVVALARAKDLGVPLLAVILEGDAASSKSMATEQGGTQTIAVARQACKGVLRVRKFSELARAVDRAAGLAMRPRCGPVAILVQRSVFHDISTTSAPSLLQRAGMDSVVPLRGLDAASNAAKGRVVTMSETMDPNQMRREASSASSSSSSRGLYDTMKGIGQDASMVTVARPSSFSTRNLLVPRSPAAAAAGFAGAGQAPRTVLDDDEWSDDDGNDGGAYHPRSNAAPPEHVNLYSTAPARMADAGNNGFLGNGVNSSARNRRLGHRRGAHGETKVGSREFSLRGRALRLRAAEIASVLGSAKRPRLHIGSGLVGRGGEAARRTIIALAEAVGCAVTTSSAVKGVFPETHPLWVWAGSGAEDMVPTPLVAVDEEWDAMVVLGAVDTAEGGSAGGLPVQTGSDLGYFDNHAVRNTGGGGGGERKTVSGSHKAQREKLELAREQKGAPPTRRRYIAYLGNTGDSAARARAGMGQIDGGFASGDFEQTTDVFAHTGAALVEAVLACLDRQRAVGSIPDQASSDGVAAERSAEIRVAHEAASALRGVATRGDGVSTPATVLKAMQAAFPGNTHYIADGGMCALWATESLRLGADGATGRFMSPSRRPCAMASTASTDGANTAGFAVAAAVGAALAAVFCTDADADTAASSSAAGAAAGAEQTQHSPVVAIVGEGEMFLPTAGDLSLARARGLPVVVLHLGVRDCGELAGLLRMAGRHRSAARLAHAPYDATGIAASFGVPARRVARPADVPAAMQWALECARKGGPVLLDIAVDAPPSLRARGLVGAIGAISAAAMPVAALKSKAGNESKNKEVGDAGDDDLQAPLYREGDTSFARRRLAELQVDTRLCDALEPLDHARRTFPQRLAVVAGGERHTYETLATHVSRLAHFLHKEGRVTKGDRVALMCANVAQHQEAQYAIMGLARGIVLNCNQRLAPPELAWILDDAAPVCGIISVQFQELALKALVELAKMGEEKKAENAGKEGKEGKAAGQSVDAKEFEVIVWVGVNAAEERVAVATATAAHEAAGVATRHVAYTDVIGDAAAPAWFEPEPVEDGTTDGCQMYYTSGTTGRPKGVVLSHANVVLHALGCMVEHRITANDVWGHIAPMFHLVDAYAVFSVTWVGGTHVFPTRNFSAESTLELIEAHRVTVTNMASTMATLLLSHPTCAERDLTSLQLLSCGGAPLSAAVMQRAMAVFQCEFFLSYGMTECCGKISMSLLTDEVRLLPAAEQHQYVLTSGRPFGLLEVRVVDVKTLPTGVTSRDVDRDGKDVGEVRI